MVLVLHQPLSASNLLGLMTPSLIYLKSSQSCLPMTKGQNLQFFLFILQDFDFDNVVKKGGFFQKTLGAKDGTVRLLPGRADTYCCNRSKDKIRTTIKYLFVLIIYRVLTFIDLFKPFPPLFQFLSWPSALLASLSTMLTSNTPTSVEGGNR